MLLDFSKLLLFSKQISNISFFQFAVLLAIVFLLELSAGLAGYVLKDGLKEYLVSRVNVSMQYYSTDPEIARTIDFMQEKVCYRNL
jgi:Tetraspanin family.